MKNVINIHSDSVFVQSQISISGSKNVINIEPALNFHKLFIELRGNNKKVTIKKSKKNINGLQIKSIRGNSQTIFIDNDFGCGGVNIQMNDGDEHLHIGRDCLFSWDIKIRTSDGHSIIDLETNRAFNTPKDVKIGNHCWICEGVNIMKGSEIPDNSVVGAFALVTKKFETQNVVIAGFPAKIVRNNVNWDRRRATEYNDQFNIS
ncbi:MAG: hypothetical protein IPO21_02405 [Bacteroidales bacterium]|nr:hypothetical protein [Bacteroidales bacterium]